MDLGQYHIKEEMQKERRIVMILDNFSTHKSKYIKEIAKNTKYKINIFTTIFTTIKPHRTTMEKNETNNEEILYKNKKKTWKTR